MGILNGLASRTNFFWKFSGFLVGLILCGFKDKIMLNIFSVKEYSLWVSFVFFRLENCFYYGNRKSLSKLHSTKRFQARNCFFLAALFFFNCSTLINKIFILNGGGGWGKIRWSIRSIWKKKQIFFLKLVRIKKNHISLASIKTLIKKIQVRIDGLILKKIWVTFYFFIFLKKSAKSFRNKIFILLSPKN